jgi:hypothetical protein
MPSLFPPPGPFTLPQSTTLLVKGLYHASAPIHFCLTFIMENPTSKAVFLSPSRQSLTATLQEYNDDWITAHSDNGFISGLSSRISVLFVPLSGFHSVAELKHVMPAILQHLPISCSSYRQYKYQNHQMVLHLYLRRLLTRRHR